MKFSRLSAVHLAILLLASSSRFVGASSIEQPCVEFGFSLELNDESCDFASLLVVFDEDIFQDPINRGKTCTNTAEEDLIAILGVTNLEDAQTKVHQICINGFQNYEGKVPFENIAGYGTDFDSNFFNGGTGWNEEQATMYPPDKYDSTKRSNILRDDSSQVNDFYRGQGAYGMVEWPDFIPNFENCQMNTALCCWLQDRQAGDNNGNCNEPYDTECIDRGPTDNTDLCFVDLAAGAATLGYDPSSTGSLVFQHDDSNNAPFNGEGPIHCHGFAWANDDTHPSSVYKGNNLFYVSMYDNLYQRGYVRNIPGAPMCGCAEQMPVVSRADCTEMDISQRLQFDFDENNSISMTVMKIDIGFYSCQGTNRQGSSSNNDLWSHANRLYRQDLFEENHLVQLSTRLVGDHACRDAERSMMNTKNYTLGYEKDESAWTKIAGRDFFLSGTKPMGTLSFGELYSISSNNIIHRVCAECYGTHQHIYYRRLTLIPDGLDLVYQLIYGKQKTGQEWGVDFEMYSTYEDAVADENRWVCDETNGYIYRSGFPGDCGPDGSVTNQGSLFNEVDRANVAFFLDAPFTKFSTLSSTNIGGHYGNVPGAAYEKDGKIYLNSNGIDIWDKEDSFQFYYDSFGADRSSDVDVVVKLETMDHKGPWSRAGLMIRESLSPSAAYFGLFLSGIHGVITQYRQSEGDATGYRNYEPNSRRRGPIWLRIMKIGDRFHAFISSDNDEWTGQGGDVPLSDFDGSNILIGLVVSTFYSNGPTEAIFTNFSYVEASASPSLVASAVPSSTPSTAPSVVPSTTLSLFPSMDNIGMDIGDIGGLPGSASHTPGSNQWIVTGSGADIWTTEDAFHFVPSHRRGDFTIRVFIEKIDPSLNDKAKAGIMIRESLDADSANAFAFMVNDFGLCGQYRAVTGLASDEVGGECDAVTSGYVELKRKSGQITFRRSRDGINWEAFHRQGIPSLFFTNAVYVGLAVTSHDKTMYATAYFRHFEFIRI